MFFRNRVIFPWNCVDFADSKQHLHKEPFYFFGILVQLNDTLPAFAGKSHPFLTTIETQCLSFDLHKTFFREWMK